jgi:hypothetical protein
MSYADAVKWVKAKAKEDGKDYVYVMEAEDHEVGMAQGQLDAIHKDAAELQEKIGGEERDLPGWIQSHITSAYEYLKQANDNFHELKEEEHVDEKLKMLMDPLMVKIMKQFGFNSDPGIKAELREEIKAAVEAVLKKHDIIVEGTFNDGEIAIYTDPRGDAGETHIWKRGKGYYGQNDSFDFEAKDKKELEMKLKRWGYVLIAGSIDEAFQAEAEEPLAKLALSLLAIRDQAHMFHWQTQSYEQHMAFGEFYEDFADKMDELMENIMGKSERPAFVSGTITLAGYSDSEVIEFINTAKNVFDLQLPTVVPTEGNSEIYNLVEEVLSMLNKLQYLLSLK